MRVGYLYLARRERTNLFEWKPGQTTRSLAQRERELSGQTDEKFTIVFAIATRDCRRAEQIAFERIDALGLRKYKGTRKELVQGSYEQICAILREAAAQADREYEGSDKQRLDDLEKSFEKKPFRAQFLPKNKFCAYVLTFPMQVGSKMQHLHQVLERSLRDESAKRVLSRHGVRVTGERLKGLEVEVAWFKADKLVKWLNANLKKIPAEPMSRFLLSRDDTHPSSS